MKDRFDVQLGVARPAARTENAADPAAEAEPEPVVVVEYRNRGVPAYLVPPLLIVLAALGIMSYQNLSASLPLRPVAQSSPVEQGSVPSAARTGSDPAAVDEKVEAAQVVVVQTPEDPSAAPRRPPIPAPAKPTIEVVETSTAKPAAAIVPAAPTPMSGPEALFDHETVAGLRPVGGPAHEPPLVTPPSAH